MSTPAAPPALPDRLRFGRFELRPQEQRLLADGEPVALGGRAFDLLLALARRPGELLTRNELIEQVWPGRVVEENNLSVQVNALRKVLGGEWLATVPGRGYRFVAPVVPVAPASSPAPADEPSPLPQTHLPTLQPLLVGRSDDLAALGTLVDQHRLVTIVGAGGMGKTRLAQALLQMRVAAYPQGVCWIELGSVDAAAGLPAAVAAALGLPGAPGDALAPLARAVAPLQMLLALDNAEHLLDAVAALAQALLDAAPGLRLVVTSQAPLRLAAERVLRLGPLALPQGPLPARQAQAFGAVALFCERAAAADHRFVLKDADVPAVIELCRSLDGVALGIELAAARAPSLGIAGLQASLADRLRVLSSNRDRLAPARQQSLRAALEWSVALLAPAEQQLFRRMAVLAGGGTLALVQQVGTADAGAAAGDPWEVVDALDQLVQRSLVELLNDDESGPPRYRLLESPRALALEQLRASGEEPAVRLRHAHGVLAEFDRAQADLQAGRLGLLAWRRRRLAELPNAREAIAQARQQGLAALELALASEVLTVAPHDERLQLVDRCEQLIAGQAPAAPLDSDRVYRAWRAISTALANLQPARSLAAAREALVLARRLDEGAAERRRLYDTLCTVAHMLTDEDKGTQAEPLLREALALASPDWPPATQRVALRAQASLATVRGAAGEALALYRRLLALDRVAGESGLTTLVNVANAELASGDAAAAVATGLRLVEQLRDPRSASLLMYARINLAAAHLALDDTTAAREVVRQMLAAAPRPRIPAWCVDVFALLAALEGRHEAAAQLVGAADARYEAAADRRQVNEERAHERTLSLLGAACDATALAALREQGRTLADAELAVLALAAA
ncbi:MAG: helix-turn-helix transcriptional regulator [Rubrivivax sp.]|nr:helix-turn-helix transcriptional regulator [Rubrivivax sp.]